MTKLRAQTADYSKTFGVQAFREFQLASRDANSFEVGNFKVANFKFQSSTPSDKIFSDLEISMLLRGHKEVLTKRNNFSKIETQKKQEKKIAMRLIAIQTT